MPIKYLFMKRVVSTSNHSVISILKHHVSSHELFLLSKKECGTLIVSFSRTTSLYYNQSVHTSFTRKHWNFGVSRSVAVSWAYCLFSRSFWCDAADRRRSLLSLQLSRFSQCYHKDAQVLSHLLTERERGQAAVQAVLAEADPAHHLSAPEDLPRCHPHWLLKSPSAHLLAPWRTARGS